MRPLKLNDSQLITELNQGLSQFGYASLSNRATGKSYEKQLSAALRRIMADPQFGTAKFSLLRFSAQCREAGKDDVLFDLWHLALLGALHLLKWHDRRINVARRKRHKVTPPLIKELVTYYSKLRRYEPLLYGSDQFYRDHFAHVLRVWMLGAVILASLEGDDHIAPPRLTEVQELNQKAFTVHERLAIFTIAALTHDMGYPIEKLAALNSAVADLLEAFGGMEWQQLKVAFTFPQHEEAQGLLRQIASKPQFRRLADNTQLLPSEVRVKVGDLLEKYSKSKTTADFDACHQHLEWGTVFRCQWKYLQKYASSLEKNEHGFISALLLQRKALYFREGEFSLEEDHKFLLEEARQFMIRREILRAVASHTCPDIYFLAPLSAEALLFFCDEIQDWGRPYFSDLYRADLGGGALKVTLKSYSSTEVAWKIEMRRADKAAFAWRTLSTASSLYERLRSAPDSLSRDFKVDWVLRAGKRGSLLQAHFSFNDKRPEKERFKLSVNTNGTGSPLQLIGMIEDIATGKVTFATARERFEKQL
jgi:hypothetical protein